MLILAADTSGKHGSIALAQCDGESCNLLEVVPLLGGTFSAQLVPQIAALLAKHGFSKQQIGGFAVASGPGSFTGLRVGLAAIKGLAEILEKPIVAVSLLQALAARSGVQGQVVAVLDAGRNEVFLGDYDVSESNVRLVSERLVPRTDLRANTRQTVVAQDPDIAAELREAGVRVIEAQPITSHDVAKLGWRKIRAGETISPEELDANYIRRSDAEIFSKPSPSN
jgi:tRNA threonylcarbamoyladenosine biosynthesis protein TsaB